jgi:hypothetical protein
MPNQNSVLAAALRYAAEQGWEVFPAPPGQKKSYKSAAHSGGKKWGKTKIADEIRSDWAHWPDANVGIPTGAENGFWVTEADTAAGHAVDGIANFNQLVAGHEPLPQTRMAISPSGSLHYYWQWPADLGTRVIKNSASRIAPGVDVRGEGGMVIAPPSVKPGVGQYRWLNDLPLAPAPQWLVEKALAASSAARRGDQARTASSRQQPDLTLIADAVQHIPNNDLGWDDWNKVIMAIWAATGGSDEGFEICDAFSQKSNKYDAANTQARWDAITTCPPDADAVWLFRLADEAAPGWRGVKVDNFYAYMPLHKYMFAPAHDLWPGSSVNARIPPIVLLDENGQPQLDDNGEPKKLAANVWLDQNKSVEQMTWAPGLPMLVQDRLISEGGWITRYGVACFNLYRAPTIPHGEPNKARPWLRHVIKVYGKHARHIIYFLAHRVQHPEDKINHALLLGGPPGIGKDTLLEPVKHAIGPWNFLEVSPKQMMGRFNGFLKSIILRISEVRDLGEFDRFTFYDHMKVYTAAPPDVLRVDEKNIREHYVLNVCGVIMTTNHKMDGLYLPPDDRRHYVAWSQCTKDDFTEAYWNKLWEWYPTGGNQHVTAYLANLDLEKFNAKAPPPKTAAFWAIVDAGRAPEDAELADVLDALGNPLAVTLSQIIARAPAADDPAIVYRPTSNANSSGAQANDGNTTANNSPRPNSFGHWLRDRRNRRVIPHRLEKAGYVPVRNDAAQDGYWVVDGRRQTVYAKNSLSVAAQMQAAQALQQQGTPF